MIHHKIVLATSMMVALLLSGCGMQDPQPDIDANHTIQTSAVDRNVTLDRNTTDTNATAMRSATETNTSNAGTLVPMISNTTETSAPAVFVPADAIITIRDLNTSAVQEVAMVPVREVNTTRERNSTVAPTPTHMNTTQTRTTDTVSTTHAAVVSSGDSIAHVEPILFDFDQFVVRLDMLTPLHTNARLVAGKTLRLEGNCDEFGSDEYNLALGLKRANAVKTLLVNEGMNPNAIQMKSYGEANPVCVMPTEACWAKNRRVDFRLP